MRVAITGATGRLGRQLARVLGDHHELMAFDHHSLDVADPASVELLGAVSADVVIHTAAWTDVDGCARDPDRAYLINALGTRNVCLACQRSGAVLLYVSTNEVFDGCMTHPYTEFDEPRPINQYGRSKLAGERFVQGLLDRWYVVRTSWVFGPGREHFIKKIIAQARSQGRLRVVKDEVGSPTYTVDLAVAIARLIDTGLFGTYHFTNSGICSRFEYACEVLCAAGLEAVPIEPTLLQDYRRASTPPAYSALRNFCGAAIGITLRPWQDAVREYIRHDFDGIDHHPHV